MIPTIDVSQSIEVAEELGTKRVIYSCNRCKKTRTRDYMYEQATLRLFRMEGNKVIYQEQDMFCSCCVTRYMPLIKLKASHVHAVTNQGKTCDARCAHAKGKVCMCSCGGKNHGKAFLSGGTGNSDQPTTTQAPSSVPALSYIATADDTFGGKLSVKVLASNARTSEHLGVFDDLPACEEAVKKLGNVTWVSPYRFAKNESCG